MKNCTHCTYAKWNRTALGKLHPSGYGECTFEYKLPPLPACRYWYDENYSNPYAEPVPYGELSINRHVELTKHCPYYTRVKP